MEKLYAAPLEGVTGYVWRCAHRLVFGGADRYYTPFLTPDSSLRFQTKELRELSQGEQDLVPQILTNRSDYFLWAAGELATLGFREVNLNLGCPSGTVVAKNKGSGLLRHPQELEHFLDEIFSAVPEVEVSVKTRIGMKDPDEWPALLAVFARYPIRELTVHPRLQSEFYRGTADRTLFLRTMEQCSLPLVYNGDVTAPDDPAFSYGCGVMVGRGLVQDPALLRRVRGGLPAGRDELIRFHELLVEGYREYMPGDLPLIHRMREFWSYFVASFADAEREMKRMAKAKHLADYLSAADGILRGCPLSQNHEAKRPPREEG